MSLDDRIDSLERRLAVLETLVRQLAAPKGIPVGSAPQAIAVSPNGSRVYCLAAPPMLRP